MGKFLCAMALATASLVPSLVQAHCYSVYDRDGQVIYQDTQSPIDLRQPIADAVKQRFSADARMVFTPVSDDCAPVDKTVKPLAVPEPTASKR